MMIYTPKQLKSLILPILQSMPVGDEDRVADAIVEIINQDRQARPVLYPVIRGLEKKPDHNNFVTVNGKYFEYYWEGVNDESTTKD